MTKKSSPHTKMLNLMIGYWVSRLIQIAAQLKLADLLKDGPRTADELAAIAVFGHRSFTGFCVR